MSTQLDNVFYIDMAWILGAGGIISIISGGIFLWLEANLQEDKFSNLTFTTTWYYTSNIHIYNYEI